MEIDSTSLRCMAPSLGIPPHRHYDPSDLEDAALRLEWAKFLFRAGFRLRFSQVKKGRRGQNTTHTLRACNTTGRNPQPFLRAGCLLVVGCLP